MVSGYLVSGQQVDNPAHSRELQLQQRLCTIIYVRRVDVSRLGCSMVGSYRSWLTNYCNILMPLAIKGNRNACTDLKKELRVDP